MIDGETRVLGVIGDPVTHTLSPAIQNAALEHFGMNYRYLAFPVPKDRLKQVVQTVRLFRMPGLNVTLPHKERILSMLDRIEPMAKRLGAVNTVVHRDGQLIGENTDYRGFEEALKQLRAGKPRTAVLFGAGGAARAVLAVLVDLGFREVTVVCRQPTRGRRMVNDLEAKKVARVVPWDRRESAEGELLVNATALGLHARDPLPVSARVVRHAKGVVDLVVRPRGTRWLALARSYNVPAEEGSTMLIAQGRESFRLWFGKRPPLAIMQRALRQAAGVGR